MNKLTRKIRNKGYSLTEFLEINYISLRTYRRYEKPSHISHGVLVRWVDVLQYKGVRV